MSMVPKSIHVVAFLPLFLLSFPSEAAERELHLVAGGARALVIEPYLRALCTLLRNEKHENGPRYRRIGLFRAASGQLASINRQLGSAAADVKKADDFASLVNALHGDTNACAERSSSQPSTAPAPKSASSDAPRKLFVLLEWVSGERKQRVKVTRAVWDDPSEPVSVEAPVYLRMSSDTPNAIEASARELALHVLPLENADVIDSKLIPFVAPHERCREGETHARCVHLDGRMTLRVRRYDTYWLPAKRTTVRWRYACGGKSIDLAKWRKRAARTRVIDFSVPARAIGTCLVQLEVSSAYGHLASHAHEYAIHAPPLLVDGARAFEAHWRVRNNHIVPFSSLPSNGAELVEDLDDVRVVSGDAVVRFGKDVRKSLIDLGPVDGIPSLAPSMRGLIEKELTQFESLLGYRLLRGKFAGFNERRTRGDTTVIVPREPLCESLADAMSRIVRRAGVVARSPSAWTSRCLLLVRKKRREMFRNAVELETVIVSRHPSEQSSHFRAIAPLTDARSAEMPIDDLALWTHVEMPLRARERYLLQGVSGDRVLTMAAPITVENVFQGPDLFITLYGGVTHSNRSDVSSVAPEAAIDASFPFLFGTFVGEFRVPVYIHKATEAEKYEPHVGVQLATRLELVSIVCVICRLRGETCRNLSLGVGLGPDLSQLSLLAKGVASYRFGGVIGPSLSYTYGLGLDLDDDGNANRRHTVELGVQIALGHFEGAY